LGRETGFFVDRAVVARDDAGRHSPTKTPTVGPAMSEAEGQELLARVERLGRAARLWRAAACALAAVLLVVLLLWVAPRDEAETRARETPTQAGEDLIRWHVSAMQRRAQEFRKSGGQGATAPEAPMLMPRADEP
jgi:hypothetical protein